MANILATLVKGSPGDGKASIGDAAVQTPSTEDSTSSNGKVSEDAATAAAVKLTGILRR